MASEKSTDEARSRYNKGTIRGDLRYLAVSKDVRRHRLIFDIKRCRRTSFDTARYRRSPLIVPLLYLDLASSVDFSDAICAVSLRLDKICHYVERGLDRFARRCG